MDKEINLTKLREHLPLLEAKWQDKDDAPRRSGCGERGNRGRKGGTEEAGDGDQEGKIRERESRGG